MVGLGAFKRSSRGSSQAWPQILQFTGVARRGARPASCREPETAAGSCRGGVGCGCGARRMGHSNFGVLLKIMLMQQVRGTATSSLGSGAP